MRCWLEVRILIGRRQWREMQRHMQQTNWTEKVRPDQLCCRLFVPHQSVSQSVRTFNANIVYKFIASGDSSWMCPTTWSWVEQSYCNFGGEKKLTQGYSLWYESVFCQSNNSDHTLNHQSHLKWPALPGDVPFHFVSVSLVWLVIVLKKIGSLYMSWCKWLVLVFLKQILLTLWSIARRRKRKTLFPGRELQSQQLSNHCLFPRTSERWGKRPLIFHQLVVCIDIHLIFNIWSFPQEPDESLSSLIDNEVIDDGDEGKWPPSFSTLHLNNCCDLLYWLRPSVMSWTSCPCIVAFNVKSKVPSLIQKICPFVSFQTGITPNNSREISGNILEKLKDIALFYVRHKHIKSWVSLCLIIWRASNSSEMKCSIFDKLMKFLLQYL